MMTSLKFLSADAAVSQIQSNQTVFVQGSAATPLYLLHALEERARELSNVQIISISLLGDIGINKPEYSNSFFFNTLFVSEPTRRNVNELNGDYLPVFLSEIHILFERGLIPLDVALIHVSPPDKHGFCSLGISVDVTRAATKAAKKIIAQVNPQMPRTHGDGVIHISEIDALVEVNEALPEVNYSQQVGEQERIIGRYTAEIIDDRSTLQLGIGTIPDAVLQSLSGHKDLGIHTEMFSDGVMELMKKGVITNAFKKKHRYKTATSFAMGTRALYDFVDDNPEFAFLQAGYINNGHVIRSNPRVAAVNSAIEVDLTGQVCADSIGSRMFSGVGGQVDFIRGASLSEGGKPIIAMASSTGKGASKIVTELKPGAGVVTTRAHMHYIVTEHGVAYLYGKNLHQRAMELIKIAAPEHREKLEMYVRERFGKRIFGMT
jgi:acyl-CoA hydrolase